MTNVFIIYNKTVNKNIFFRIIRTTGRHCVNIARAVPSFSQMVQDIPTKICLTKNVEIFNLLQYLLKTNSIKPIGIEIFAINV